MAQTEINEYIAYRINKAEEVYTAAVILYTRDNGILRSTAYTTPASMWLPHCCLNVAWVPSRTLVHCSKLIIL